MFQHRYLPLNDTPLIHCVTNSITSEFVANVVHAIGGKPIMVEDHRELERVIQRATAVCLNLGQLTPYKEKSIKLACRYAKRYNKPIVLDVVGITVSTIRYELTQWLLQQQLTVVKGNLSEMKTLCQLQTDAKGVDTHALDTTDNALNALSNKLYEMAQRFSNTLFLATGPVDIVVCQRTIVRLKNGVPQLDCFSGSGDALSACLATVLTSNDTQQQRLAKVIQVVTYFNCCGEQSDTKQGIGTFKVTLLDRLEQLQYDKTWPTHANYTVVCSSAISVNKCIGEENDD